MSGVGLANKIREDPKLKGLKLAFLTVVAFSEKGKEETRRLEILDHIQKPFDNEDLVRRVKRMVGE
jgi:response regulator RpfG family c-di-GMP phosphodiesterase